MVDSFGNVCFDCGWEQMPPNANKYLRKCPDCGASFSNRYVKRVFARGSANDTIGDSDE